jgi:hypothetical protein
MSEDFHITIEGDWVLARDQIWPDGDGPENPTVDDVRAVLPDNVSLLISEWNLRPDVDVWVAP